MQINVIFDASADNAPAGFKTDVMRAVQFLDNLITTPITVNIRFGYGELNGQALDPNAIGESLSNYSVLTYGQVRSALIAAATSSDNSTAVATLPAGDPTGGGEFWLSNAEQKALGVFQGDGSAVDGYVALSSNVPFNFDPNQTTISSEYDAFGALLHEITEVLGRVSFAGAIAPDNSHVYAPLDLFRYASAGVRSVNLTYGQAYFSVDGHTLLTDFNPAAQVGGDSGDWGQFTYGDAFNAFTQAGAPARLSSTDLRVLDLLGYTLKSSSLPPTTPAPQGAAPSQFTLTQDLHIAAGANVNILNNGPYVLQYAAPGPAPSLYNAGTIFSTIDGGHGGGSFSAVTVGMGVFHDGQTDVSYYLNSALNNLPSGKIYVSDTTNIGIQAYAYAPTFLSGSADSTNINNQGYIQVVSINGTATGLKDGLNSGYTINNSGEIVVWSLSQSEGIHAGSGITVVNSGTITVSGSRPVGVDIQFDGFHSGLFTNSGLIVATTNNGLVRSIGVEGVGFTNTGTIIADIAVEGGSVTNFGTIDGDMENMSQVINRGVISGKITLHGTYDGRHGSQTGGIDVSGGFDTVIGGVGQTVAIFNMASSTVTWTQNSDRSWKVTIPGHGFDTLTNVQVLQFTDTSVTLPFTPPPQYPDTHDFYGHNVSDILIEGAGGAVVIGEVGPNHQESYSQVSSLGPEWLFKGAGDFVGSGRDQFLIENASGVVELTGVINGQAHFASVAALGPEWAFVGVGNFLAEDHTQFLIENTAGLVVVGDLQNGQANYTAVGSLGLEWTFVGAGDFLGEGHAQFLIENTVGLVAVGDVQNGQAHYTAVASLGPEWTFVGAGDFLGEGHAQFLIENTAGLVAVGDVQNGQAHYTAVASLGSEWTFVGAGDFLGEGHAQFLIENAAGAVAVGDIINGQAHYSLVGGLGSEWSFHI